MQFQAEKWKATRKKVSLSLSCSFSVWIEFLWAHFHFHFAVAMRCDAKRNTAMLVAAWIFWKWARRPAAMTLFIGRAIFGIHSVLQCIALH